MIFNLKSAFLLGLAAVSVASPTPSSKLVARARIPETLQCDGAEWTKQQIYDSIAQAQYLERARLYYPREFRNRDANGYPIFEAQGRLWEFPLLYPVWDSK